MSQIQRLLTMIGEYHRAVRKALTSKRDRAAWNSESKRLANSIRQLLSKDDLREELDRLLESLHRELGDDRNAANATSVLSTDLAEFVKAEAGLHRLTHVRSRVYLEMVNEVRPWIASSLHPEFPANTLQFLADFNRLDQDFVETMDSVPNLSRWESKTTKTNFSWKLWRYSLGTLVTLANIYMTYHQPSFQGMGTVSISVGAWYFGRREGAPRKPPASASHPNDKLRKNM